jgi:RNA ligase (TIGR02306 family)
MGYRLKTLKKRGELSQGLVLPLSEFPEITSTEIESDLTELLSIYKFDPPLPASLSGEAKGSFPGFLSKTDEERIQNIPDMLERYKGHRFYITSKIDGTSCTCFKFDNDFNVCGRNLNLRETPNNTMWRLANKYDLKNRLPNGYAIQAECAGEGIQSNRQKLKGQDLFIFYVINIGTGEYLQLNDMLLFAKDIGIKTVPVIDDNFIMNHTMEDLLKMADSPSPFSLDLPQEGMVLRLYESLSKVSFKVISNEYLIKYGI